MTVSNDVLRQACDDFSEIMIAEKSRGTQFAVRDINDQRKQSIASAHIRWVLSLYTLVTGVATGLGYYFRSPGGFYFYGALFLVAVFLWLTILFDQQFIKLAVALLRRFDKLFAFAIRLHARRSFRQLREKTPYVIRYVFQPGRLVIVRPVSGQTDVLLNNEQLVLKKDSYYLLVKLSSSSQTVLASILTKTDDQRLLVETILDANGISCRDAGPALPAGSR